MKTFVALICLFPSLALAEMQAVGQPVEGVSEVSSIVFQATSNPDAVSEVVFNNRLNNDEEDVAQSMTFEGVTIEIEYYFNVHGGNDDAIEVRTPPGYYADPSFIQVQENNSGIIYIYQQMLS